MEWCRDCVWWDNNWCGKWDEFNYGVEWCRNYKSIETLEERKREEFEKWYEEFESWSGEDKKKWVYDNWIGRRGEFRGLRDRIERRRKIMQRDERRIWRNMSEEERERFLYERWQDQNFDISD